MYPKNFPKNVHPKMRHFLVTFLGTFYGYIFWVHFIMQFVRTFFWYIWLVHFLGTFFWCIFLVHFLGTTKCTFFPLRTNKRSAHVMPYAYVPHGIYGQIFYLTFRKKNVHLKKRTGVSSTSRMPIIHLAWSLFGYLKSLRRTRLVTPPTAVLLKDIPVFDLVLL